jgi:hypothetical protein
LIGQRPAVTAAHHCREPHAPQLFQTTRIRIRTRSIPDVSEPLGSYSLHCRAGRVRRRPPPRATISYGGRFGKNPLECASFGTMCQRLPSVLAHTMRKAWADLDALRRGGSARSHAPRPAPVRGAGLWHPSRGRTRCSSADGRREGSPRDWNHAGDHVNVQLPENIRSEPPGGSISALVFCDVVHAKEIHLPIPAIRSYCITAPIFLALGATSLLTARTAAGCATSSRPVSVRLGRSVRARCSGKPQRHYGPCARRRSLGCCDSWHRSGCRSYRACRRSQSQLTHCRRVPSAVAGDDHSSLRSCRLASEPSNAVRNIGHYPRLPKPEVLWSIGGVRMRLCLAVGSRRTGQGCR